MTQKTTLHDIFQNPAIHDRWEAAYRGNALLDRFNDRLLDRLVRCLRLQAGDSVLDAGCGVGDHTLRFARSVFHCVGVERAHSQTNRTL